MPKDDWGKDRTRSVSRKALRDGTAEHKGDEEAQHAPEILSSQYVRKLEQRKGKTAFDRLMADRNPQNAKAERQRKDRNRDHLAAAERFASSGYSTDGLTAKQLKRLAKDRDLGTKINREAAKALKGFKGAKPTKGKRRRKKLPSGREKPDERVGRVIQMYELVRKDVQKMQIGDLFVMAREPGFGAALNLAARKEVARRTARDKEKRAEGPRRAEAVKKMTGEQRDWVEDAVRRQALGSFDPKQISVKAVKYLASTGLGGREVTDRCREALGE